MVRKALRFLMQVVVLCVLFTSACYAETGSIDISQLSNDEITILSKQIQQEMVARGMAGTASLLTGRYVGGKDIPSGTYLLYCKTDDDQYGIVWVSAASDDLDNEFPSILYEYVSYETEMTYYIEIEEGGILYLPFPAQIQISTGILFE